MFSYRENDNRIGVYLDNVETSSIPEKNSNYLIDKIVCDNDAEASWDNVNWSLSVTNLSKRSNCKLYFRSKKDVTVTYDNNYIKNNIFEDKYNTGNINISTSCGDTSFLQRSISEESGYKVYNFVANSFNYNNCYCDGPYFSGKSALTDNQTHYYTFEAKASSNFTVNIGSEQNGKSNYDITTEWKKYSYEFITSYIVGQEWKIAFSIYWWLPSSGTRTLEIRNIQIQEGEYDNYSNVTLKEYDNLGNLSSPSRDGYTFLGWYTEPIDGEKISDSTPATEDTTYYAHWQYNG